MAQRRIIYIKNPDQGSHFRTLDGGGGTGGGGRQPRAPRTPGAPRIPHVPGGTYQNQGNGAIYNRAPSDWAIGTRDTSYPGPAGTLPNRGRPYYELPDIDIWMEPESIWIQMLLIAQGVDPYSGQPIPMRWEPGWVAMNPLNPSGESNSYPYGKPRAGGLPQNRLYWYPGKGIIKGRPKP
jgi:hypothetical protein